MRLLLRSSVDFCPGSQHGQGSGLRVTDPVSSSGSIPYPTKKLLRTKLRCRRLVKLWPRHTGGAKVQVLDSKDRDVSHDSIFSQESADSK